MSLEAYTNWIMRHHSFRATRHHVLAFVLYNMLLLRQSSLGNNIQFRNNYWTEQVDIMAMTSKELKDAALEMKGGKLHTNPVLRQLHAIGNPALVAEYFHMVRHDLNRLAIERFAKTRNQKVWMFAAKHSRTKSPMARNSITVASLLNLRLFVVVWIHLQDGGCAPNQARLIGRVDS
jgi:hypothetical protein